MKKFDPDHVESLLEEGVDLVERILAKEGGEPSGDETGQEEASEENMQVLVDFVHGKALFKDADPELIHEATERVPALAGKSAEEMVALLRDDPDTMNAYTRVLARLEDEAEGRPQGDDDDGRLEPADALERPGPGA